MKCLIMILSLLLSVNTYASVNEGVSFPTNCARSKDPTCWERMPRGGIVGGLSLMCARGKVVIGASLGEGPGCGEGPALKLLNQTVNPINGFISVTTTATYPRVNKPYACHYWGPIYDTVALEVSDGTWTVYANNQFVGTVAFDREAGVCEVTTASSN